jgi:hypothetical protein
MRVEALGELAWIAAYGWLVRPDDFASFDDFLFSASIVPILVSVRLHAARHSAFVICVWRSQKFMQSARVLPPPPGVLGAGWLALPRRTPRAIAADFSAAEACLGCPTSAPVRQT